MRNLLLVGILALAGCDDTIFPNNHGGPTGTTTATEGWCAVQGLFRQSCLSCHSAASALGGLDLETDPHAALVGVTSAAYGAVLVEPGNAGGSLLYRKLAGSQAGGEGGVMPPTGAVEAARLDVVKGWIDDGASDACEGGTTGTDTGIARYHPADWALPEVHGLATKLQTEADCRDCHGADLSGGKTGISCTSCHGKGWEVTCTYCHGDEKTGIAAPPEDIDDNTDMSQSPFRPHLAHVTEQNHSPFACTQCHVEPTSALTPGHLFDDATPGVAEVDFSAGLSPAATWNGTTCSNLYCHGNGQGDNGSMDHTNPTPGCDGCHPDPTSAKARWDTMSGHHEAHLEDGLQCWECHDGTLDAPNVVADPSLHVNGQPDVQLPATMDYDNGRCTGQCHGQPHLNRIWQP